MMKLKFNPLVFFLGLGLITLGCKSHKGDFSDFDQFYEKFMQDSVFQMQHINFPLDGLPDDAANYGDSIQNFRWTKENWRIHHPIDFEKTKFEQNFQTLGDELIIENITEPTVGYGMLRRWAKIDGKWTLIYYVGLNPIQQ